MGCAESGSRLPPTGLQLDYRLVLPLGRWCTSERPLELELDLLLLLASLVLDAELSPGWDADSLTGDLYAERLVGFEGIGEAAQLRHHLPRGVRPFDVARCVDHALKLYVASGIQLAPEDAKSRGLVRRGDELDPVAAFEFMKAHQAEHAVATMARLLGVSTSGYHAWRSRSMSARARRDGELADQGVRAGRQRIARLMRAAGLEGVSRRAKHLTTRCSPADSTARTCSSATSPPPAPTRSGWRTPNMAIWRRRPEAVIHLALAGPSRGSWPTARAAWGPSEAGEDHAWPATAIHGGLRFPA